MTPLAITMIALNFILILVIACTKNNTTDYFPVYRVCHDLNNPYFGDPLSSFTFEQENEINRIMRKRIDIQNQHLEAVIKATVREQVAVEKENFSVDEALEFLRGKNVIKKETIEKIFNNK